MSLTTPALTAPQQLSTMAGHPQVSLPFLPHPVDLRIIGATHVLILCIFHLDLDEISLYRLEDNLFLII
jgi:hypothetical protein